MGILLRVSNGPIQFKSARKIWPLLEFLTKNYTGARLLACSLARLLACSLARASKIFATARMLIFLLT